ncbi:MAG: bifunctional methylenetetrahydrofolate dehydrogenase/methenyltetrahydrofolate cyclohydrolase FolD [Oligosphaeraceae bacterium]|nr:bifunctional methylenetetrahydrofolate dehydrogenase/methenyltetrahydrofolate cyclohydrolase FolD [Oligosphaeraceae bacterium]
MSARIIDGKQVAADIRQELQQKITALRRETGIQPGLAVVLVGTDPASQSYVSAKEKACAEIGIFSSDNRLPAETSEEELLALIDKLNHDPKIHGILVQLPLPRQISESKIINAIDPEKDVDGFHPVNVGRMVLGEETYLPCTPHGVLQLLQRCEVKLSGAEVVVVGRSNIVGKPLANLLVQKAPYGNATVTICHTRTRDLRSHTLRADIIIAAAGCPNTITADMVKPGAVVIDVGVNRVDDPQTKRGYRLTGDVDFAAVSEKAALITPVPGGVGPMTITMLLFNTVQAAQKKASHAR